MRRTIYLSLLSVFFATSIYAQQFNISAEIRPRFENRHGYKTLINKGIDGANFISQRSRLNFNFKNNKLILKISLQNIRVWGDVSTLSSNDNANSFHEAWAEAILSPKVSLKIGYDDSRIFGNVGWAQQARSHDAAIFKYIPNNINRLDIGFALNADSQALTDALYSNVAGYKNFQYAWYHGNLNKFGLSMLLLNTGIEYLDNSNNQTIDYMQTIGSRLTYKSGKFKANAATYYQLGQKTNNDVSASYFTGNLSFKTTANFNIAAGFEYLSGKDTNDNSLKVKSFSPLFGTNHKFNGWMDYFYVGNFTNSVGLTDINMTLAYKIAKDISFNAGYSTMYATKTMEVLKGGNKDANNSWTWIMFTFKPKLFSTSK